MSKRYVVNMVVPESTTQAHYPSVWDTQENAWVRGHGLTRHTTSREAAAVALVLNDPVPSITVTVPASPTILDADAAMEIVSAKIGHRWIAAYGDGGWMFKAAGEAGVHFRGPRTSFLVSLSKAIGREVIAEAADVIDTELERDIRCLFVDMIDLGRRVGRTEFNAARLAADALVSLGAPISLRDKLLKAYTRDMDAVGNIEHAY